MRRLPRGSRARATVLVVTIVVVVIAATLGPVLLGGVRPAGSSAYSVDNLIPERAPADGEVAVDQRDETGVVLVDIAHRNRMSQDEIKPLLSAITTAGYQIDLLEGDDDFDRSLTRADAFIVIDPSDGYTDEEVTRVAAFVNRGGRLLLVGEPTTLELAGFGTTLRVNRLTPLSSQFGFEFGEAHLFNMHTNDGNHLNVFVEPATNHRLTRGVSRAAFYTTTAITVREGQPLLVASESTRSSRTDQTGTYPVAAVNGDVLALADGSFLRRGNFNIDDNEQLLGNIVRFLVSGEKQRTLDGYPTFVGAEPTIGYTGAPLIHAAQGLAVDLRQAGHDPTITIRRGPASPDDTDILVTTFDYLQRHGQLGTGVRVTGDRVAVREYSSATQGIVVVRAPANGFDLVIVADTPTRASRAVDMLADGSLREHLLTRRTAVVRTTGAVETAE